MEVHLKISAVWNVAASAANATLLNCSGLNYVSIDAV